MWDDIALEIARTEREAFDAVRRKIASQQLGEAWVDLFVDLPVLSNPISGAVDRPTFSLDFSRG